MPFSGLRKLLHSSTELDDNTLSSTKKRRQSSLKFPNLNSPETDLLIDIHEIKENTQPMAMAIKDDPAKLSDEIQNASLIQNVTDGEIDSEELQSPPSSPQLKEDKDAKPASVFSLAQVSIKLNELWSTAQEKVFGDSYWIPSNVYDVAIFPNEILKHYQTIYPPNVQDEEENIPTLRVVESESQMEGFETVSTLTKHVVFSHAGHRETLSIFRTNDVNEAMDFCRRCEECRVLFKMLDLGTYKDIRRQVRDLTNKIQVHLLWRMVHIAIACQRADVFTEEGLEFLRKMGYSDDDLLNTVAQPEGKYPVQLAIETNQPEIVKFLFKHGADIHSVDSEGNNSLHLAALTSTQMIEIVWAQTGAKDLLNALNNDRNTPVLLAIRNANPFCLKMLLNIGADMSIRIAGKNPLFEAVQSKGKTMEIIRAIIDAQPDLISEVEKATGNTVLHSSLYKMPLMGVLNLRRRELDLNAKNKAGFAALHLYVARGDIGMIITLCSYGADLNTRDDSGNTALHISVSKSNLEVTRLLLCLGSNPNVINKHQDSPRHLAAKLQDHNLLKSLIMCNAKRCTNLKAGCVSGCVNEKMLRILPRTNSTQSANELENMKSPRSLAKIEKLEAPEEMVEQHSWNRFHEIEHDEIYEEMIKRLTEMAKNKQKNRNIINGLCLDGGGIRGLVIMQILLEVEYQLKEPIFQYFDWVAGTSTGSLVAAALSLGKTSRDCQMIYLRFKDLIFDGWVRPYKSVILETFIKAEMGDETTLDDLYWPRLLFTTTKADIFPVQLEFMRNYQLPLGNEDNEKLGYSDPKDLKLWKALRRSSAAPTYFSSVDNAYIDGGIMANNPTLDFLSEIQTWNSVCKSLKRTEQIVELGCLLSIGTGVIPSVPMDASQLDISNNPYSSAVAIKNLGVILVDQVTATEGAPVSRASSWCISRRTPYFRFSAPLHKEVAMDERQDEVLAKMMWDCKEYTHRQKPYIEKICHLLKLIGKSETRRHLFERYNCMATQTSRPSSPLSNSNEKEEVKFKASSSDDENASNASDSRESDKIPSNFTLKDIKSSSTLVDENDNGSRVTRTDMIKVTQGNDRKGDRDTSPKASPEEIGEAKECATKNDSPASEVTKGAPKIGPTGQLKDLDLSTFKD